VAPFSFKLLCVQYLRVLWKHDFTVPFPQIGEIAADSQYEPSEISKNEFEREWSRPENPLRDK
jgi:hypothetical protein